MNKSMKLFKGLGHKLKGISTLELLTAVSVLAVLMTSGYRVYQLSARASVIAQNYAEAEILARDLLELAISRRNEDWNSISPGQYYFTNNMGVIDFAPGVETINDFTRSLTISEVRRDGSGNIVTSGGTIDNDVYKLTSTVDWDYRDQPYNVTLEQYITNWRRF